MNNFWLIILALDNIIDQLAGHLLIYVYILVSELLVIVPGISKRAQSSAKQKTLMKESLGYLFMCSECMWEYQQFVNIIPQHKTLACWLMNLTINCKVSEPLWEKSNPGRRENKNA